MYKFQGLFKNQRFKDFSRLLTDSRAVQDGSQKLRPFEIVPKLQTKQNNKKKANKQNKSEGWTGPEDCLKDGPLQSNFTSKYLPSSTYSIHTSRSRELFCTYWEKPDCQVLHKSHFVEKNYEPHSTKECKPLYRR